ncbi:unnamed protein product [marine sediment metagenome]|uniref:Uncharacterized protein n=1 Tax=marine sediment metagenome TaxID=412755 RepID=X1UW58_9ZZZZ
MNNVNGDAYQVNMPLSNLKNRVFLDKEPYAEVYKAHLPQNTIGQAYSVSTDKTELRDLLNSELSGLKSSGTDPDGSWSNEIWDHKATFKKAVLYASTISHMVRGAFATTLTNQ